MSVISRSRTPKPLTSAPPGTRRRAVTDAVGLAPSLLPRLGAVAISVTTTALVCGDRVSGLAFAFVLSCMHLWWRAGDACEVPGFATRQYYYELRRYCIQNCPAGLATPSMLSCYSLCDRVAQAFMIK